MKALIVDDDARKLGKLIEVFTACGVSRNDIDVARSAEGARQRLRGRTYEIVILDLMLPARDESEATLAASIQLLREIDDREEFGKPQRLIGFTAYQDAAVEAAPAFRESLWTIVRYDDTSDEWEEQFRRVIRYVREAVKPHARPEYQVDLCIVTALQSPELDAVHSLPWAWEPAEPMDDATFVRFGTFASQGQSCRVVSSCTQRMGSIAAALLTAGLIAHLRPRFVVMAGICAGVKQKVNIGDPVLFSPTWEWASGKVVPDGDDGSTLEAAPHQLPVSEFVLARAEELKRDKAFWLKVKEGFPQESDVLPKFVIAPGASGPSVVAHKETSESIKLQHRKVTAIDMEAYGMCAAANSASTPKPTAFAIKSVSDFADEEKDDKARTYAAYTSATVVREYFERYMTSIRVLAGT